jgi:metal-dependent hydrolase (beta-lactamase superfamily II)
MGSGVSVVERTYALVGGFHLALAPDDYLRQVMAELKNPTTST